MCILVSRIDRRNRTRKKGRNIVTIYSLKPEETEVWRPRTAEPLISRPGMRLGCNAMKWCTRSKPGNCSAFLGPPMVHYRILSRPPLVTIFGQTNTTHTLPPIFYLLHISFRFSCEETEYGQRGNGSLLLWCAGAVKSSSITVCSRIKRQLSHYARKRNDKHRLSVNQ
jgi:hypothetical protein